jgi:hypothetical protein
MSIVLDGTNGITTPDLESAGPITGTTGTFSGNVTLGSSVLATPTGSAPSYTCRAWVNFNGTGTVAIRASGNVSSITDNGVGDYTVNFTTAMPDTNYAVMASCGTTAGGGAVNPSVTPRTQLLTTTSVRVVLNGASGSTPDLDTVSVAIFR